MLKSLEEQMFLFCLLRVYFDYLATCISKHLYPVEVTIVREFSRSLNSVFVHLESEPVKHWSRNEIIMVDYNK